MAEALAKDIFSKKGINITTSSRGIYALEGEAVSKNAVAVMNEMGINANNHTAKPFTDFDAQNADYIFTMTKNHKEFVVSRFPDKEHNTFTISEYSGQVAPQDVSDPFGGSLERYMSCAKELFELITIISDKLLGELK